MALSASRADRLRDALSRAFPGGEITVRDDSHHHAGHGGARPEGETHYAVRILWDGFNGVSRVNRQRAVNAAAAPEFGSGLHALAIEAKTPGEG